MIGEVAFAAIVLVLFTILIPTIRHKPKISSTFSEIEDPKPVECQHSSILIYLFARIIACENCQRNEELPKTWHVVANHEHVIQQVETVDAVMKRLEGNGLGW